MFLEDIQIYRVGSVPYLTIQGAVNAATVGSQAIATVVIPANYAGTDTVASNSAGVTIQDYRSVVTSASFPGSSDVIIGRAAATVTAAVAATSFNPNVTQAAGLYRVSGYISQVSIAASAAQVKIGWTGPEGAQVFTSSAVATAAGSFVQFTEVIQSAGSAQITYSVTAAALATYNLALQRIS